MERFFQNYNNVSFRMDTVREDRISWRRERERVRRTSETPEERERHLTANIDDPFYFQITRAALVSLARPFTLQFMLAPQCSAFS